VFSIQIQMLALLFGSVEPVVRPTFPSCGAWEAPRLQVEQVSCYCKEAIGLDFCVGNLLRPTKFFEVYLSPRDRQHPLFYLKFRIEKQ
jgi:hypothetical protein